MAEPTHLRGLATGVDAGRTQRPLVGGITNFDLVLFIFVLIRQ